MKNNVIALIIIVSFFELGFQYLAQKAAISSKKNNFNPLLLAMICLLLYGFLYYHILKSRIKLGIAHTMQHCFGIALVFLIGYVFFGQKINKMQMLGIILLTAGISLITFYDSGHSHDHEHFHTH